MKPYIKQFANAVYGTNAELALASFMVHRQRRTIGYITRRSKPGAKQMTPPKTWVKEGE